MNRSELREKAMITVYQYLLVKRDTKQLIEEMHSKWNRKIFQNTL